MFKIINYDKIFKTINIFNSSSIDVQDNENLANYIFFINSIKNEFNNISIVDNYEKKLDIELIIGEYFQYFSWEGMLNVFPNVKDANALMYYEIQEGKQIYIGSVLFKIKDNTLYFISIYKSIINKCFSCNEIQFSRIMLDYLLKIAQENHCINLITFPLDIMKPILLKYGFIENSPKIGYYLKSIEINGGKKYNIRIKNKKNKRTKRRKNINIKSKKYLKKFK